MNVKKKWLAGGLVVLVVAVPLTLKNIRANTGIAVNMAAAAARDVRPSILASGALAYRNEVNLTAEVVAKVASIAVKEGDVVERGQLLLTLDPTLYRNALEREEAGRRQSRISIDRQRAALDLRERQFERSRKLIDAQIIDRNRFEEDRNQFELARTELRSSEEALRRAEAVLSEAREQLAKTEIRSPIAGRVVALPIKIGETAIPSTSSLAGAQLMKIAETSAIQAELKVDEADIAKISIGQRADVHAAAYPDQALQGTVEQIALAPTIEGQGRAYKVTVSIVPPKGLELRSGMSVRANIFLSDGRKRLALPVEAILSDAAEGEKPTRYVWLARNGVARKTTVRTGASDDRWEVVEQGVAAGDTVITGPAKTLRTLREGDRVSQRETEAEKGSDDMRDDRDADE
ncbi:efflux RND transporter periplasmic adaptor subunit [Pseudoxanthomonas mexicana]